MREWGVSGENIHLSIQMPRVFVKVRASPRRLFLVKHSPLYSFALDIGGKWDWGWGQWDFVPHGLLQVVALRKLQPFDGGMVTATRSNLVAKNKHIFKKYSRNDTNNYLFLKFINGVSFLEPSRTLYTVGLQDEISHLSQKRRCGRLAAVH